MEGNSLIRVIHVVVDRVKASLAGARIAAGGAAGRGAGLGGGVGDLVAGAGAAALEGVVETEPVADLVGGGLAEVVVGGAAAGDRRRQDGAAVVVEVVGARADVVGEVAVAGSGVIRISCQKGKDVSDGLPEVAANLPLEVDVQGTIVTLAERLLHGQLSAIISPVGVDGAGGAGKGEGDARGGEVLVEDGELLLKLGVLQIICYLQVLSCDLVEEYSRSRIRPPRTGRRQRRGTRWGPRWQPGRT